VTSQVSGTEHGDAGMALPPEAALSSSLSRPNAAVVDLGAITSNARIVRGLAGQDRTIFGAVKGNGYSLGLPQAAQAMLAGGIDGFTLSDPADATRIREAGIAEPILLYGGVLPAPDVVAGMLRLNLMGTVTDAIAARAFSAAASACGSAPLRVFAKVDVGLERLGVYAEEGADLVRLIGRLPGLSLAGVYTHLHGSADASYLTWQLDRFDQLLDGLIQEGIDVPIRLGESSASLGTQDRPRLNAIDPGHLLYGILPLGRRYRPTGLRPALRSLTSRIIHIKTIKRLEYQEQSPVPLRPGMRIGVIPIGRGDGLRSLTAGHVRIRNNLVPVVGRLSLEHTRLDLTDAPDCRVGDEVELIGGAAGTGLSAAEIAAAHQLDPVGLLMEIRASIPRVYLRS
jgi:alanine racemase